MSSIRYLVYEQENAPSYMREAQNQDFYSLVQNLARLNANYDSRYNEIIFFQEEHTLEASLHALSAELVFAHYLVTEFGGQNAIYNLEEALRVSHDSQDPFMRKDVTLTVDSQSYDTVTTDCIACSVCQSDFLPVDIISTLKCSHIFHTHCISEWAKYKAECPHCKSVLDVT
jgi:hypothetical protein